MLDVTGLLNAPAPWEAHGATAPLPPGLAAILAEWPGKPADFFTTSGTADDTIRRSGFQAPGLIFGDAADRRDLAPGTLAALQAAVTALAGQAQPHRLVLAGPIAWDGTLLIDDVAGVTLDFSAAQVQVLQQDAPLIRLTRSQRVTIRGLRLGQRHATAIDISASQDVALTDMAIAGAADQAVRLSGGAARVLIDRSAFLRNTGPGLRALGEVAQVILSRCAFEGPSRRAFVELTAAHSPRGYAAPEGRGEASPRDALTRMAPTDVRILENRFGALDQAAVEAQGTLGLWLERNDFAGAAAGALRLSGPAVGLMLADNRIGAPQDAGAPLVRLSDVALACIFRNTLEPASQSALVVEGGFGGLLVAANTLMVTPAPGLARAAIAIRLAPQDRAAFLSATLMLNTLRGPFGSGITLTGALPRLFLFDNHLFGMTDWSLESRTAQPMATSMNNWSPVKSLNLPLSEALIDVARMVRSEG